MGNFNLEGKTKEEIIEFLRLEKNLIPYVDRGIQDLKHADLFRGLYVMDLIRTLKRD
jgi:hypothetical protein